MSSKLCNNLLLVDRLSQHVGSNHFQLSDSIHVDINLMVVLRLIWKQAISWHQLSLHDLRMYTGNQRL